MKSTHLTDSETATRILVQSRCPDYVTQLFETPSASGEGVTGLECPCCNGDEYLQIDEHEVERCPFC